MSPAFRSDATRHPERPHRSDRDWVYSPSEELDLETVINESLAAEFHSAQLKFFQDSITNSEEILYLCDNAGAIVFDRLLIEDYLVDIMQQVRILIRLPPQHNAIDML